MSSPRPTALRTLPAQAKRERIFTAAREVILRRGFDGATMEEIAGAAGVGKGTLYNFFESKEALLLSLVEDGFERTRAVIDAELAPIHDPWERFEVGWRTLMRHVFPELARQWNFNYQLWGFLARDPEARRRLFASWRALYREREARIVEAVRAGQRSGVFRKEADAEAVALVLMAIFDGLLHRTMFDPDRVEAERALEAVLDLLRGGLCRAPRGRRR